MNEKPIEDEGFHALMVVLRDYVSYGDPGIDDLKEQVTARHRKPVIDAFCEELRQVLAKELPVPTELINTEFSARAAEAGIDPLVLDEREAYEALSELWEHLGLEIRGEGEPGNPGSAITPPRAADKMRSARPRFLWVDDPVDALKTWVSWRFVALFVGGIVVAVGSWALHDLIDIGFISGLFQLLTIVGFASAAYGGSMLWLRRVRYVDPDAYLPADRRSVEKRKR